MVRMASRATQDMGGFGQRIRQSCQSPIQACAEAPRPHAIVTNLSSHRCEAPGVHHRQRWDATDVGAAP